jgi:hypothetical protein
MAETVSEFIQQAEHDVLNILKRARSLFNLKFKIHYFAADDVA